MKSLVAINDRACDPEHYDLFSPQIAKERKEASQL